MVKPKSKYYPFLQDAVQFLARDIPPRTWLLTDAIPHPSVGMLYAWRGTGKTYTALDMALAISHRKRDQWMFWMVPETQPVLYIDGEMPLGDLAERIKKMSPDGRPTSNLVLMASEDLATDNVGINLAKAADRKALTLAIAEYERDQGLQFGLIILDNWTSLIRGVDENDNAAIDAIKEWLIQMRHLNQSILIVHHAGKGGHQRGASAREDLLDYSIELSEDYCGEDESRFRVKWDKTRTGRPQPSQFIEILRSNDDGSMGFTASQDLTKGKGMKSKGKPRSDANQQKVMMHIPGRIKELVEATKLQHIQVQRCLSYLEEHGLVYQSPDDDTWHKVSDGSHG